MDHDFLIVLDCRNSTSTTWFLTNINRPSLDTGHTIWSIPLPRKKKKTLNRELLHPWGWKKLLSHFQKNWCFPWTWHRNTTNSYSPVVGIDRLTLPFLTSFPACDPWVLPSPHSTKLQIHVAIGRHGSITTCHIQNCGPHCWNCAKSHEIFHMCHMTLPHFKNVMT